MKNSSFESPTNGQFKPKNSKFEPERQENDCLISDFCCIMKKEVVIKKIEGPYKSQHGEYNLVRIVWQDHVDFQELMTRCNSSVAEGLFEGNQAEVELYFGNEYIEILQMKKIDIALLDELQEMVINDDLPY